MLATYETINPKGDFLGLISHHEDLAHLTSPIRQFRQDQLTRFRVNMQTPHIAKAQESINKRELLTQNEMEKTCTKYSFLNQLRILDGPKDEYTDDFLTDHLQRLGLQPKYSMDCKRAFMAFLLKPFDHFEELTHNFDQVSHVARANKYFTDLEQGAVGTIGFAYSVDMPDASHERTVAGMEVKPELDIFRLALIDPINPSLVEKWDLDQILAAMAVDVYHQENFIKTHCRPPFLRILKDFASTFTIMVKKKRVEQKAA